MNHNTSMPYQRRYDLTRQGLASHRTFYRISTQTLEIPNDKISNPPRVCEAVQYRTVLEYTPVTGFLMSEKHFFSLLCSDG